MPTTPTYAFRYPAGTAPPDVPTDVQNLATDVETLLSTKGVVSAAAPSAANQVPVWNGTAWVYQSVAQAQVNFPAQTYAVTWTAATTAPVIGNGLIGGFYVQIGKLVLFHVQIVPGTTTTYGAGSYYIGLPVAANTAVVNITRAIGFGVLYDSSSGQSITNLEGEVAVASPSLCALNYAGGAPGVLNAVTPTQPWTWANGDVIRISGVYIAA